jgi:RNA polymerase sigma factor (sigma-70 family)
MSSGRALDAVTQGLLRNLAPQVLGVVVRRFGDFAASEDAVQEALIAAAEQWPDAGVPESPRAWLVHVAARRITDHVRAEVARRRREAIVASLIPAEAQLALEEDGGAHDDTLEMFFMCCHPALSPSSAIALTLRAVGGLTTAEIATAFLVPEATMAQRISRAKQSLASSSTPIERLADVSPEERASRVRAVAHVLYLIFNEGYVASGGDSLVRTDLANEAIRLARVLRRLVPDDTEVAGLLALMLLTDARRAARTGPAGELVPLDEQDRGLWDGAAVAEGAAILAETLPRGAVGPYQLQAAIAAVHDEAPSADATDWPQILGLYGVLRRMADNPMAALSEAIATAMVHGPRAGLARIDAIAGDARLAEHHRLHAARAHLLERAGDRDAALEAYRRAASLATSTAERDYLLVRAARLSEPR